MTNIKVFYNDDDCRRFKLKQCTSAMLWQQLASLFDLDMSTFFDEHRMTMTHGGAGVQNIAIPSMDELSTILGILNSEELGNKPVVVRITMKEAQPAGKPNQEATEQVKTALNDAHVAALAQLDHAKSKFQAVKAASRQTVQAAREQAHQHIQAALEAVTSAKNMASKTGTALKAMGIKPTRASTKTEETEQDAMADGHCRGRHHGHGHGHGHWEDKHGLGHWHGRHLGHHGHGHGGHGRWGGWRRLLATMNMPTEGQSQDQDQETHSRREGHHGGRGHCRRGEFGGFGGFGCRRWGSHHDGKQQDASASTHEMRLKALDHQLYKMKARRTFHEAHGVTTEEEVTIRDSHLARMSERIAMLEQAREHTLKTMEEHAAGERAAAEPVMAVPVMASAPTIATEESADEIDDVQDSDTSEDWVELSLGSQVLEVGDQVMLKSLATGQLVGIDSVNREVVMLQDADDASGLMQVVASRVEGALKLRAVVNPKAFLRLGPKADGLDMKGLGGVWTDFEAQLDSDGTVSLMSARRPNHYAACVDDALKAVLVAEGEALPRSTKFVVRKMEA